MSLAVALLGVLLIVAALVVWQHSRGQSSTLIYGVEDAVGYAQTRLPPEVLTRLGEAGIRRIMEWEVFYLQGLAQENRFERVETVAGPYEPAVLYIAERIKEVHDCIYSLPDIEAVLELQVAYLAHLGAIGEEVGGPDK